MGSIPSAVTGAIKEEDHVGFILAVREYPVSSGLEAGFLALRNGRMMMCGGHGEYF